MASKMAASQNCTRGDNNELWNLVWKILYKQLAVNFPHETKTYQEEKGKTHQETEQEKGIIIAKIRPRGALKNNPKT